VPRGRRGSLADPSVKSRIQLELYPKAREQMEWLLTNTDAASYSEVCRRALELFYYAKTAWPEGKEFGVYDPKEQHFVQVVVV
jgi:hypothetical protein